MSHEFSSFCIFILQSIVVVLVFFFVLYLAQLLVKLSVIITDWIGFFIHFIYWKVMIWWHGWEHDVPDYWNDFDVDAYIQRIIELETINTDITDGSTDNTDNEVPKTSDHIIIINPCGEISLGKHIINSN